MRGTDHLYDTYKAMPIHFPGTVLADLAVATADGADSISDGKSLRDQPVLFGSVASTSTAWRVLDRVTEVHLSALCGGRTAARAAVWEAGAASDLSRELCLDINATIVISHSGLCEKHTFGFHPLLLVGSPRPLLGRGTLWPRARGEGGLQTTADHICVQTMAKRRGPNGSPLLGLAALGRAVRATPPSHAGVRPRRPRSPSPCPAVETLHSSSVP
jgi:hypothetical protein